MTVNATGYALGDRIEVTIERIVSGGAGLARGPAGVILVDLAAPGDVLDIQIESLRGGVARGRIVSIIEPSVDRIDPPCPWYGICGGCDFQHLRYDAQLDAKENILRDALERIGRVQWAGAIERFPAKQQFGNRTRVELHSNSAGALGFYERRSDRIVEFDHCLISDRSIDQAIQDIRATGHPSLSSIHLLAGDTTVHSFPAVAPIEGGPVWMRIGEFEYRVDPAAFFQSSIELLPDMIDRVVGSVGSQTGQAWDLFCGAGLFSLPLAQVCDQVVGIEIDKTATRNGAISAKRNGINNIRFDTDRVDRWLRRREWAQTSPDFVVVDPPRAGLGRTLATLLAEKRLPHLTYVSCDPATLARDLQVLTSNGLQIADIAMFDLFPQTHHVETIVRMMDRTQF